MSSPLITIVTPSYNLGNYIDRAMFSVLNQSFKDFEYWIIDGGSTDNTLDIINNYSKNPKFKGRLHWLSEKDSGQTNAINKGLKRANGRWFTWLNADDYYEKDALKHIASIANNHDECGVIYGNCLTHGEKTLTQNIPAPNLTTEDFYSGNQIFGPSAFFNMTALSKVGIFDEDLDLWMDFDMFIRISKKYNLKYTNKLIAHFTERPDQKSHKNADELLNESRYVIGKNRYPILKYYYKWKYL